MVVVRRRTQQSVAMVLRHAVSYFGPEGLGLHVQEADVACVCLRGAADYVTIRAYALPATGMTAVEVESAQRFYVTERFLGVI